MNKGPLNAEDKAWLDQYEKSRAKIKARRQKESNPRANEIAGVREGLDTAAELFVPAYGFKKDAEDVKNQFAQGNTGAGILGLGAMALNTNPATRVLSKAGGALMGPLSKAGSQILDPFVDKFRMRNPGRIPLFRGWSDSTQYNDAKNWKFKDEGYHHTPNSLVANAYVDPRQPITMLDVPENFSPAPYSRITLNKDPRVVGKPQIIIPRADFEDALDMQDGMKLVDKAQMQHFHSTIYDEAKKRGFDNYNDWIINDWKGYSKFVDSL